MGTSNYISPDKIPEVMLEYIEENDNCQAILLNGSWGCGKTHFIENTFFPKVRAIKQPDNSQKAKYQVARVSLYGVSSREEVESNVATAFLSPGMAATVKVGKALGKVAGGFLGGLFDPLQDLTEEVANKGTEKASEWLEKQKKQTKLLVLDDFERSAMNPTELMGIVNNYVENESYKIILLANEKELAFSDNKQADLALQYDVVLNHQDKIELADGEKRHNNQKQQQTASAMSIKQLKELTEQLFPTRELYERTKEKLIGLEITFRPDFEKSAKEIVEESVKKCKEDTDKWKTRQFVLDNLAFLTDAFAVAENRNFRTLNAVLVTADKLLLPILREFTDENTPDPNTPEEDKFLKDEFLYEAQAKQCLEYIAYAWILKSQNVSLPSLRPDEDYALVRELPGIGDVVHELVYRYKFVDDYMETHRHDDGDIMGVIDKAVAERKKLNLETKNRKDYQNLSLFHLNRSQWTRLEDDEVKRYAEQMLVELEEKKYLPRDFQEIIITLMDIQNGGLGWKPTPLEPGNRDVWSALRPSPDRERRAKEKEQGSPPEPKPTDGLLSKPIKEYVEAMVSYFKVESGNAEKPVLYEKMLDINNVSLHFIDAYREYIKPLLPIVEACERERKARADSNASYGLNGQDIRCLDWNGNFHTFCREHENWFYENGHFLSLWKADELSERLNKAKAAEISDFSAGLSTVYSIDNYDTALSGDKTIVSELLAAIRSPEQVGQSYTRALQLRHLAVKLESMEKKFSDRDAFS